VKEVLRPLLFWEGDTADIEEYDKAKWGAKGPQKTRLPIHEEVNLPKDELEGSETVSIPSSVEGSWSGQVTHLHEKR
jgi:hypothetical protein